MRSQARDAEALGHRRDITDLLAIAQHHPLGTIAGARGEEDDAIVARGGLRDVSAARLAAGNGVEQRAGGRRVEAAEREARHAGREVVARHFVVMDGEPRPELRRDAAEMAGDSSPREPCRWWRHTP